MADTPSAWKIEKALAAWNEAKAKYADTGDEESAAAFLADTHDIMGVLHRLIKGAVYDDGRAVMCKNALLDIAVRAKRHAARQEKKREIILQLMDILGMKSEDFGDVSVAVSPGVSSVVITDEAALTDEYVTEKTVRTPDKRAIKADLEQGVVIEGACLSNAVPFITIRTK